MWGGMRNGCRRPDGGGNPRPRSAPPVGRPVPRAHDARAGHDLALCSVNDSAGAPRPRPRRPGPHSRAAQGSAAPSGGHCPAACRPAVAMARRGIKGVRGGRSPVGVAPLMRVAGRGSVVVSWSCPAPQAAPRPSPPPRVPPAPGRTAVRPVGGRPGRCPLRSWPLVAPPRCSPPARFAQLPPCGPSPGYAVCSVQEAAEPGSVPGRGAPPRVGAAQLSVADWRRLLHCRGGAGPARRALLVASRPPGRAEQTASGFWGLRSAPGCDMLCISSI